MGLEMDMWLRLVGSEDIAPLWPLADTHHPGCWGAKGTLPKVPCSQSVGPRKSSPCLPPPRAGTLC